MEIRVCVVRDRDRDDCRARTLRGRGERKRCSRRGRLGTGAGKFCTIHPPRGGLQYDVTERARNPPHKTRVRETEGWHEGSDGVEGCAQERTNSGGVRGGLIWKEEYGLVSAAKEYTRDERR